MRVTMTITPIELGRECDEHGAHFEVRDKGRLFGRLSVGKKGLRWWANGAEQPEKLDWEGLDAALRPPAPPTGEPSS